MIKWTTVLLMLLLASCSGDDGAAPVSKQKVDNSSSANDRLADSNQRIANETSSENENPFAGSAESLEQEVASDDQNAIDSEEDYQNEEPYYDEPSNAVTFRNDGEGIVEWQAPAEIAYSKAEVQISMPNGELMQRSYIPGESMVLDETLPDGLYVWESVVTPEVDAYTREEMNEMRQSGNLETERAMLNRLRQQGSLPTEAQAQANRQSGSFTVIDGVATPIPSAASDQTQREDG